MSEALAEKQILKPDNEAVLKHIDIYQGIINRMAGNSSACKNWCIVLVSAFLAFAIKDNKLDYIGLVAFPIFIFWFLDTYYLGLERKFIKQLNDGMRKLRNKQFTIDDLFKVKGDKKLPNDMLEIASSWSVLPVYGGLFIMMLIINLTDNFKFLQ